MSTYAEDNVFTGFKEISTVKWGKDETENHENDFMKVTRIFSLCQSQTSDSWHLFFVVTILVLCFLISSAAIIFAIKNQLCGHCVLWWRQSQSCCKGITESMRIRYKKILSKSHNIKDLEKGLDEIEKIPL